MSQICSIFSNGQRTTSVSSIRIPKFTWMWLCELRRIVNFFFLLLTLFSDEIQPVSNCSPFNTNVLTTFATWIRRVWTACVVTVCPCSFFIERIQCKWCRVDFGIGTFETTRKPLITAQHHLCTYLWTILLNAFIRARSWIYILTKEKKKLYFLTRRFLSVKREKIVEFKVFSCILFLRQLISKSLKIKNCIVTFN